MNDSQQEIAFLERELERAHIQLNIEEKRRRAAQADLEAMGQEIEDLRKILRDAMTNIIEAIDRAGTR